MVVFDDNLQTVQLKTAATSSGPEKDGFTFDRVFPMVTKQYEVFEYGVQGIVKDVPWVQWDHLCLWSNRLGKDLYDDGSRYR